MNRTLDSDICAPPPSIKIRLNPTEKLTNVQLLLRLWELPTTSLGCRHLTMNGQSRITRHLEMTSNKKERPKQTKESEEVPAPMMYSCPKLASKYYQASSKTKFQLTKNTGDKQNDFAISKIDDVGKFTGQTTQFLKQMNCKEGKTYIHIRRLKMHINQMQYMEFDFGS